MNKLLLSLRSILSLVHILAILSMIIEASDIDPVEAQCREDLYFPQDNGNYISQSEWVTFVERQSNYQIRAANFDDLPVPFRYEWVSLTCKIATCFSEKFLLDDLFEVSDTYFRDFCYNIKTSVYQELSGQCSSHVLSTNSISFTACIITNINPDEPTATSTNMPPQPLSLQSKRQTSYSFKNPINKPLMDSTDSRIIPTLDRRTLKASGYPDLQPRVTAQNLIPRASISSSQSASTSKDPSFSSKIPSLFSFKSLLFTSSLLSTPSLDSSSTRSLSETSAAKG